MNCPIDNIALVTEQLKGIEIDRCPKCHGMWLDYNELDQLEDTVFSGDSQKGTMIWNEAPGELPCPKCGKKMDNFSYRLYSLELQLCPDKHGFWLDDGEDVRIEQYMQKQSAGVERQAKAQNDWAGFLKRVRK